MTRSYHFHYYFLIFIQTKLSAEDKVEDDDALLVLRSVIFQLDEMIRSQDTSLSLYEHLPILSKMLQGVEERLEVESQQKKIRRSIMETPSGSGESASRAEGIRSVLKVFMNNQLDLNQTEMEYYENVINDCLEKLESLEADLALAQEQRDIAEAQVKELQQLVDDEKTVHREQLLKLNQEHSSKAESLMDQIEHLSSTCEATQQVPM